MNQRAGLVLLAALVLLGLPFPTLQGAIPAGALADPRYGLGYRQLANHQFAWRAERAEGVLSA